MSAPGSTVPTPLRHPASSLWDVLPCLIVDRTDPSSILECSEPLAAPGPREHHRSLVRFVPSPSCCRRPRRSTAGRVFSCHLKHRVWGLLEVGRSSVQWNFGEHEAVLLTLISRPSQKPVSDTQELAAQIGAARRCRRRLEWSTDSWLSSPATSSIRSTSRGRVVYANPIARRILGYEGTRAGQVGGSRIWYAMTTEPKWTDSTISSSPIALAAAISKYRW